MLDLIGQLTTAGERRSASAAARWDRAADFAAAVAALRADYEPLPADDVVEPLADIAEVFGLDDTDVALLWSAAAVDLDANVGIAYALVRGMTGLAWPSVGLALELAGVPTSSPEAFARLGPSGPLQRHRLVEIVGGEPWLGRAVRAVDPVVATLSGGQAKDPLVVPLRCAITPLKLPGSEQVARAVEDGVPLVWIRSGIGAAGASLAAGALASIGLRWLGVDARRIGAGHDAADAMAASARQAGLLGRALVVAGGEALADAASTGVFDVLSTAAVPVIVTGSKPWNPTWLPRFPLVVEAQALTPADRQAIWEENLGELVHADEELRQTLAGLRLTPEDVREASRYARTLAAARDETVTATTVREAARRVGGTRGSSADRIETRPGADGGPTFDDLILPEHVTGSLRQLVSWGRHRDEVTAHGPLRRHGRGIAALFAGSPGTGKTLAAHVIAEELSVDLFQVELSAMVDKYIGETEKNLERVFQAAESLDVVLFFDEADALFGSRSEVHDAHDRYANQEIAYLLQRMEHFEGITILATNLRGNLDRALSRRMTFIVHFPDPDAKTRRRLWEYHLAQLPALDRRDPVKLDALAEDVDVTGGDIRNIVLAAAYDAATAGERVGMRHIVEATIQEYHKLGKVVPDHRFRKVKVR